MSQRRPNYFDRHPATFNATRSQGRSRGFCEYVADGDSYDIWVDLGYGHYGWQTFRLNGFDTPETHKGPGITAAEIEHGKAARAYVRELIQGKHLLVRSYMLPLADKEDITLARYVADIWVWFYVPLDGWGWVLLKDLLDAAGFRKRKDYV